MPVSCIFVQPDFVRWLISDGFVSQSKRALKDAVIVFSRGDFTTSGVSSYTYTVQNVAGRATGNLIELFDPKDKTSWRRGLAWTQKAYFEQLGVDKLNN